MSVPAVHRLLSSLERYGVVIKNQETKKFRLGLSLLKLGVSIRDNSSIRNSALPVMERVMHQTKESVYLTIPEGDEGVFVECVHPPQLFLSREIVGVRSSLGHGDANKIILAYKSNEKRKRIMQSLFKKGELEDLKGLEKELSIIKNAEFLSLLTK